MNTLPTIICSTVVRMSKKGESHGSLYRVNLETKTWEKLFSYEDTEIDWLGRGGDRGLRGVIQFENKWYATTTDSLLEFSQDFKLLHEYKNKYLQSIHEVSLNKNSLYISSTAMGCIIVFDLKTHEFTTGYNLNSGFPQVFRLPFKHFPTYTRKIGQWTFPLWHHLWKIEAFNPNITSKKSPSSFDLLHINNVCVRDEKIFFSGTTLPYLLSFTKVNLKVQKAFLIERQTHNPTIDDDVLYYNATKAESIVVRDLQTNKEVRILVPEAKIPMSDYDPKLARQRFARGLVRWNKNYYIGGSSPATVTLYDSKSGEAMVSVNISSNNREAVHGLDLEN